MPEAINWLLYSWTLDAIDKEEYTSNQWELKTKYKLIIKKDNDSRFVCECIKDPFEQWLSKWKSFVFPVWVKTFVYLKDWIQKVWINFYLRDKPIEVEA